MATRWNRAWRNSHSKVNPPAEGLSIDEDELISPEANDRRLRQAINYLTNEGGSDSLPQYQDRVNKINDFIVNQYPNEGYTFDPALYRRLRLMVNDQLRDFRRAAKENVEPIYDSEEIEEVDRGEGLYRDDDDIEDEYDPDVETSVRTSKLNPAEPIEPSGLAGQSATAPRQPPSASSTDPKSAFVLETVFRYGGPSNEAEEYHRDFPASLPFGETFYMQEWESLKINYDLRESARKKGSKNDDTTTRTDVPYGLAVENVDRRRDRGLCDSGSRFRIPYDSSTQSSVDADRKLNLKDAINLFNKGGDQDQVKKDYAPRVFLEKLSAVGQHDIAPARRRSSASSRASRTPSGSSGKQASPIARRPSTSISTVMRHPSSSINSSARRPSIFDTPVARRPSISATPISGTRRPLLRKPTPIKSQIRRPIQTRRATHVAPSPPSTIRLSGHPKWAPSTPTPLTTRGHAKRKLKDADDSYEEGKGKKRAKKVAFKKDEELGDVERTRLRPETKPPAKNVKKPGAKTKPTPKPKPAPKPTVMKTKKLAAKGKGKRKARDVVVPVDEYLHPIKRAAEGYENLKRGVTRSGRKFKK